MAFRVSDNGRFLVPEHPLDAASTLTATPTRDQIAWLRAKRIELLREMDSAHSAILSGKSSEIDPSVYSGLGGIALAHLHVYDDLKRTCGKVTSEMHQHLLAAGSYANLALQEARKKEVHSAFLTGFGGPLCISALCSKLSGDIGECKRLLHQLIRASEEQSRTAKSDELLYGRAGILYSLLFAEHRVMLEHTDADMFRSLRDTAFKVATQIVESGRKAGKPSCPLMFSWHGTEYLGGAHGLAGILYMLLQVPRLMDDSAIRRDIEQTINYLCSLQLANGNFPSHNYNKEKEAAPSGDLVQFCHGATGFVDLFIKCAEVFPSRREEFISRCKSCLEVIWNKGLLIKGRGLCHGISGNAYCFLSFYAYLRRKHASTYGPPPPTPESDAKRKQLQLQEENEYLGRAVAFVHVGEIAQLNGLLKTPDHPHSLFEGVGGAVCLMADLETVLENRERPVLITHRSHGMFPGYDLTVGL